MLPGRPIAKIRAEERARARRSMLLRGLLYTLIGILVIAGGVLFSLRKSISLSFRNADEEARGREWAVRLDSSEDVLAYILEHPDDVSIAAWDVGHHADGVFLAPDLARPVASMIKIQILAAYAAAVARGELRDEESIDLAAWDAYYVAGTNEGAHVEALHSMSLEPGASAKVHLREIAHSMIRYSDNAAADYLLARLGRESMDALPRALGLTNQEDPPRPLVGELVAWSAPASEEPSARLERLVGLGAKGYADTVWSGSRSLSADDDDAAHLRREGLDLTLVEQEDFTRKLASRGTVEGYAYLMQRIARRELAGADTLYDELTWSMKSGTIRDQFDEFGSKGGSQPGVLSAAYFARPRGGTLKVMALVMTELPGAVWRSMSESRVQQNFARRVLLDDAFRAKVKSKLHALEAGDAGLDGEAEGDGGDAAGPLAVPFDAAEPTLEQLAEEEGGLLDEPPSPKPTRRKAPRR